MSSLQLFLRTNISFNCFPGMVKFIMSIGNVSNGFKHVQSNVGIVLKTKLNIGLPCNKNSH
jgi:hypothetical protein